MNKYNIDHNKQKHILKNATSAYQNREYYDIRWENSAFEKISSQNKKRVKFILDSLEDYGVDQDLEILDFGCGNGWLAPYISPFGNITSIDFSPNAIEAARERYNEHAEFIIADPNEYHLGVGEQKKFDAVICCEVIEHVEYQDAFMDQISFFLKRGGWCLLTTPNGNLWHKLSQDEDFTNKLQPIEHWLTPPQCARLVEQAGFTIVNHIGSTEKKYRPGLFGWFQHTKVEKGFTKLHLLSLYKRLVLPFSLYQYMVFKKG